MGIKLISRFGGKKICHDGTIKLPSAVLHYLEVDVGDYLVIGLNESMQVVIVRSDHYRR